MYKEYWGLTESPFQTTLDERWFYESPAHEEALARLYYLIENRRRFGVLTGMKGTGKTFVREVLARQVQRTQRQLVVVDLLGLDADELLWNLAVEFRLAPTATESRRILWQSLQDEISGLRHARLQTVLVFDHAEYATNESLSILQRLCHLDNGTTPWMTFVVISQPSVTAGTAQFLAEMADLRIELSPLDQRETGMFVQALLHRCGVQRPMFEDGALELLHYYSHGVPREIGRLCDLALLAAMGENLKIVNRRIIESVAVELELAVPESETTDQPLETRPPLQTVGT